MTGDVNVEHNTGIITTSANAKSTIYRTTVHLPEAGLRSADEVACSSHVAELGSHSAGRLFVGREDELAELEAALSEGPSVITTGLGGVGKSALAHRYAELHRDRFNPVWWIDAADTVEIELGLARLAHRLYPESTVLPDPDAAAWGRAWLLSHEGWLVVLDNATDPAHVADLVGSARGGRFVLTSRLTTGWDELAAPVPLGVLTAQQALDLLTRATGRRQPLEGAAELCEALGYLPLAVRMAAAYMSQNSVPAAAYLARLASPGGEVLQWAPAMGDPERTIARIWLVSLRGITERQGELPLQLLRVLAWLAPSDIPISLLYALPDTSSSRIDEALGWLAAYALITRDADAVTTHRMVQAVARHTTNHEPDEMQAIDTARRRAVHVLRSVLPYYRDPAGWPLWRRLVPHIDTLTTHHGADIDDDALLTVINREAAYLQDQGQPARAIALLERAVASATARVGADHWSTLTYRNNLAGAHQEAGDLGRAISMYEQILADRERILGSDDPGTLVSRNNLASGYQEAGYLHRAIPLFEHTLAASERILGPDHPDTLTSRNNLASAYQKAGDLHRAIPLFEHTLADRVRVLGPDDPDTLSSRNNLAHIYQEAEVLSLATPLHEQNLADYERVLGPDHPDTLSSRNNLALTYQAAGDLDRSIPLLEQNLAESERVLGPDHPNTRIFRRNLDQASPS